MINSLTATILGCAHKRTTFPLTPSRKSKVSEGARSSTYVVCLNCGKEFDYNWEEMRIVSPIGVPPFRRVLFRPNEQSHTKCGR